MPQGTHWPAIGFTLIAAVAVVVGATNARALQAYFFATPVPRVGPTATPRPTPILTVPPASGLASAWVDQSRTPVIVVGGSTKVVFRFRNTGTATWQRGTPSEVRLGLVGAYDPRLAREWSFPERPAPQSEGVVAPGEIATFTFSVTGPAPGTYRLYLRPVVDGVAWLTDQGVHIDIEVHER